MHRFFDLPLPTIRHVDGPDQYRAPERTAGDYARASLKVILAEGAETVAAFIAEPVMGTGGVLVPPDDYFRAILGKFSIGMTFCLFSTRLFADLGDLELGSARTVWSRQILMTTAKGLTSGYLPMSAVLIGDRTCGLSSRNSSNIVDVFGHGFTTSGHPAAAAAARPILILSNARAW